MSYDETRIWAGYPKDTRPTRFLSSAFENYWNEIQEAVEDSRGSIGLPTARFTLNSSALFTERLHPFAWRTEKASSQGQSDGDLLTDEQLFATLLTSRLSSRNYLLPLHKSFLNYTDKSGFLGGQEPTPSRCIAMTAGK